MPAIRPTQPRPIQLSALAGELGLATSGDAMVNGISLDSRDVRPGSLYVALPGTRAHGARFVDDATRAGAVAVLTDDEGRGMLGEIAVPVLVSGNLRHDMARAAATIFGHPTRELLTFGVTGTNGKTTTVALLEAALSVAGVRVGTVGTIGFRLDQVPIPSARTTVTTPEAPDLQGLLAVMAERGAGAVALEVSSHALKLERTTGIRFDVAAFLNLGRDHMDFHRNEQDYLESKARLLEPDQCRQAVVWIDDPHGAKLAAEARVPVVTVGTTSEADYRLSDFQPATPLGGRARVTRRAGSVDVDIMLPGLHNMIDAAVALAMLEVADVDTSEILRGLATAQVPGRMQSIRLAPDGPAVIVDFAHTPQAVAATLDALQEFDEVIAVLGCGGDRDPEKRPLMGRAAAERADTVIITDDNPRTEDPASIRAATMAGTQDVVGRNGTQPRIVDVEGRRAAITCALSSAGRGSVVAILGKGHETGQEIAGQVLPFDDAVEVRRAWDAMKEDPDAQAHAG